MKKIILLITLLSSILYSQHTNQLISNPTIGVGTSWGLAGTAFVPSGEIGVIGNGTTANYFQASIGSYVSGDVFKVKYSITANSLNTSTNAIYTGVPLIHPGGNQIYAASNLTVATHIINLEANGSDTNWRIRTLSGATSGTLTFDNIYVWKQIDTLWIDSAQADETDNDSTKTLTEAFETRGAHATGTFVIVGGTYAESITVDNSFTKLNTSGTVNVTQIDFNSVSATVDTSGLIIATILNDDNIIYIDSSPAPEDTGQDKGFKETPKFKKFPGWR